MPPQLSRRLPRQCLFYRPSCRSFTTTPTHHAGQAQRAPRTMRPLQKAARSPSGIVKEQQKGAGGLHGIANDMGLMPGTIIRPTGKNMPSIFTKPRQRLAFERKWLIQRFMDKFGQYHWKFLLKGWGVKPRPKLERKTLVPLAKDYHKQIYTAFAANDSNTISRLCCSGLTSTFRARMSHRAPSTHLTWTLSSYTSSPKIVSNRAAPLPHMEHSGIRQAVVRIASKQVLATWTDEQARKAVKARIETLKAEGKEITPALRAVEKEEAKQVLVAGNSAYAPVPAHKIHRALVEDQEALGGIERVEKEVTEYLVLQKRMLEGEEEDWMVWGFAEESTPEVLERDAKVMKELEAYQKAQGAT